MKQFAPLLLLLAFGPCYAKAAPRADVAADIVKRSGFQGEVIASRGNLRFYEAVAYQDNNKPFLWRWASVTKQVVATIVMQEVAKGKIDLDKPVSLYLPNFKSPNAAKVTVRMLMRHETGLPNPEDTAPTPEAFPAFYEAGYTGSRDPLTGYCAGPVKGEPGGRWAYNNCDFMVAGVLLEAVTGKRWQTLVAERIAKPLKLKTLGAFPTKAATMPGTVDGKPEPVIQFDSFGASAGLYGTIRDLWAFDRALMRGTLLPEAQRAAMWDGRPELGSIALGQWAFSAPLKGCAKPVRIVERRGAIGGVEVRNFILPDNDVVVIAFTNTSPFDFGEVWQGKGFSFDLLAAAACS